MCYRGGRGVVPTVESTSIRNCGDAYDGIRPGQMIVKFRGWPRDMVMQMRLWHIGVAEPPCEPRQIDLEHLSMSYRRGQPRKSMRVAISRGRPRKSMTCQGSVADHDIVVVRWHSTAELTPLRSVRPSYRFLRPRSRENLSPAGTSHFPRPWVGHVRRTAPPDERHGDEDIQP